MILIGQYDSPFVRRVGIALTLYALPFEHCPWSVFGDADRLAQVNPLIRVPTLVLDDGFALTDSHMILDYLDSLVPNPMFPRTEPDRHRVLKVAALGTGLADKAVSLFYERRLHDVTSDLWETRCRRQIGSVLAALEADRTNRPGPWWFENLTHADIAVACALRFASEALPGVIDPATTPHLHAACARLEETSAFQTVYQAFIAPT